MKKFNVAIVGATGVVGRTFIEVIEEYKLPINEIRLFASSKSKGMIFNILGRNIEVEELIEENIKNIDFALFSAGSDISKIWAPIFEKTGAYVIDNSKAFRMDDDKALIVPEVNIDDYKNHSKIIANPNCSTIESVIPLKALDDEFKLKRVIYTTYQAVSGSGKKGLDDLKRCQNGEKNQFYPYDISNTCIPEIDEFLDNGYTKEEMKMVNETKKILHNNDIKISATCIRVPIKRSHGVVISAECEKKLDINRVREIFLKMPGLKLADDPKNHIYPTSIISNGNDYVYVGRIRYDLSCDNGILFYVTADNVRKGAASNAVEIMKLIMEDIDNESM